MSLPFWCRGARCRWRAGSDFQLNRQSLITPTLCFVFNRSDRETSVSRYRVPKIVVHKRGGEKSRKQTDKCWRGKKKTCSSSFVCGWKEGTCVCGCVCQTCLVWLCLFYITNLCSVTNMSLRSVTPKFVSFAFWICTSYYRTTIWVLWRSYIWVEPFVDPFL